MRFRRLRSEKFGGVSGLRRLVGPLSLRDRARALSTLTRGPYSVLPWSAAEERSLFLKLPDGQGTTGAFADAAVVAASRAVANADGSVVAAGRAVAFADASVVAVSRAVATADSSVVAAGDTARRPTAWFVARLLFPSKTSSG